MVDPSQCPIPPGFEVVGDFSDNFEHFKEKTGYGREVGYSNRWKNSDIRSNSIVAGFQFKIGPSGGKRWNVDNLTEVKDWPGGDVNLFFPRKLTEGNDWFGDLVFPKRGGYIVQIKWYDDVTAFARLAKEIPHGTYGDGNHFDHPFQDRPNPVTTNMLHPRDGQWHSLLGVIYNDWYRNTSVPSGQSGLYPTIGLWYSRAATYNFDDFSCLGVGVDNRNFEPGPPIMFGIQDSNATIGDTPLPEHALQIRIDDVPTEQVEITNVYAANVIYHGPIPPQIPPENCIPQANAVSNAQVNLQNLIDKGREARENFIKHLHTVGGGLNTDNPWLQIMNNLEEVLIPNANSDLSTAKFMYGECAKVGFFNDIEGNVNLDGTVGNLGLGRDIEGNVNLDGTVGNLGLR